MSSSSESDASFDSDYFTTISNGEQILEDINKEDMAMLCMCIAAIYAAYFTHGIVQENV
jgi:hypothetical protein